MRCIRTERYKYILNLAPEILYTTHITKGAEPEAYWASWLRLAEKDPKAAAPCETPRPPPRRGTLRPPGRIRSS